MQNIGIREITEPVEFKLVGDRLHVTATSGRQVCTYSISLHKARSAAMGATFLLDRAAGKDAKVLPFGKR